MGKRSHFERVPRDFYPTPESAVLPLLPHIGPRTLFVEPCAGDGRLVDHLGNAGHMCVGAFDIEPRQNWIKVGDATRFTIAPITYPDAIFITNPPWDRKVLHPIIDCLSALRPTWLLFDSDWMHTKQAAPYLPLCRKIVSVGRVKWIPDSKHTGKDNCCWYLFDKAASGPTLFVGRQCPPA